MTEQPSPSGSGMTPTQRSSRPEGLPRTPRTIRGLQTLRELPDLIRGGWTPFREEQWAVTIAAIEEEAVSQYREALVELVEAVEGLDRKRALETLSRYGLAIKKARSVLQADQPSGEEPG